MSLNKINPKYLTFVFLKYTQGAKQWKGGIIVLIDQDSKKASYIQFWGLTKGPGIIRGHFL